MFRSLKTHRPPVRTARRWHRRLWLQGLEDRAVPALLTVTLNSDTGAADPMDPTSKGDLRYVLGLANANADADTITFDAGVTNINLSSVTGQLVISEGGQGLTIDGGGLVTIKSTAAQGALSRLFNVTATGQPIIELKGLTLTGGDLSATNNGGAIFFTDQLLTLQNCVLTGNKTQSAGGAVASLTGNANLTVTNCTFTNNSATTSGGAIHAGGAISTVTINGSVFSYNTATTIGGALHLGVSGSATTVTVNGSSFQGNSSGVTSTGHGGAIYLGGTTGASQSLVMLDNNYFADNVSGGNGGAIAANSSAHSATITLNNSLLERNASYSGGGAISINGPTTFQANDSRILTNSAVSVGGALRFGHQSTNASLLRSSVSGNTSATGGAVYLGTATAGAFLKVDQSTLANNVALGSSTSTSASAGGGGAIMTSAGSVTISNSTLSGNVAYAVDGGGAIRIFSAGWLGTLLIESSTLTNNSAPNGKGGALFTRSTPTTGGTVTLLNSIIAGNKASAGPEFFNGDPTNSGGTRNIVADYCLIGSSENNNVNLLSLQGTTVGASDAMPLNPMLAPLSTNGGIGQTHLPLPGSPALMTGSSTLTLDQLDQTRLMPTDIGAVEWRVQPPTGKATLTNVTASGSTYTAIVSYTDNTAVDAASIGVGDVLLSGPGFAMPVAPTSATPSGMGGLTVSYVFDAPAGNWTKANNGTYTLTLKSGQVFDTAMPANPAIGGVLGTFQVRIGDNFVVTLNTDENDGDFNPTDLSLREAIILANANPGTPDTISFDPSVFNSAMSMGVGGLGLMLIAGPVTITGPAAGLTLNAGQMARHFRIDGPGRFDVRLENFTLTGGKATGTTAIDRGGSILVQDEALTLSKMTVSGNEAATAGGAISINSIGSLTMVDSILSGNAAKGTGGLGGAVYMAGFYLTSLTMQRSTVTTNTATRSGGGLAVRGTVLIENSTIDTNAANDSTTTFIHGGGIFFTGNPVASGWTIRNSTISGNVAKDSGGGIATTNAGASMRIQNSTITNNTANSTSTNQGTGGGGIAIVSTSTGPSTITLDSTIVGGNFSGNDFDDIATASNLVANFSSLSVTNIGNGMATYNSGVNNTPPLLAPLGNYGGPTRTHALQFGSPMLNMGSNPENLSYDQRGMGFPRVTGSPLQADIGAFEGTTPIPGAAGSFFDITNPGTTPDTISITYSDDNAIDISSIGIDDITIKAPDGSFLTILSAAPGGSGNNVTVTYQFVVPGGSWDLIDNGTYVVTVVADKVFDLDMPPRSVPVTQVGTFKVGVAGSVSVNTNIDELDGTYGPGDLSLREAIDLANLAQFGASTINFDPTFFSIDRTIDANSSGKGELKISKPMAIVGPTGSTLTITGSNAIRVFNVSPAGSAVPVSLANLSITNGKTTGDTNRGAGILLGDDELTLTNVMMTNNASSSDGGAISLSGAGSKLLIHDSVLSNNSANAKTSFSAGAIFAGINAVVEISSSTIADNIAGNGGAIRLDGATLEAKNSTFSGNVAINADVSGNRGGGLMFVLTGSATFTNCTISGNKATVRDAGAILLSSLPATLLLNNTTVAFNEAAGAGGAFKFGDPGQNVQFFSSLVAKNMSPANPDIAGPFTPINIGGTNNLIGIGDGIAFDTNNLVGSSAVPIDPMLKPLANNGGTTKTHALMPLSPALDQGFNILGSMTLPFDQRGKPRTFDDALALPTLLGADNTDIGSFERQAPVTVTSILVNSTNDAQRSMVTSLQVSFSEPVTFPSGIGNAFAVARTQFGTTGKVGLVFAPVTGPTQQVTITFANGDINIDPAGSLADGRYLLTIFASNVDSSNGTLDGDGDLISEGSPTDNKTAAFHRLFGDGNGDGSVTAADFNAFRLAYGQMGSSFFDFNGDNTVSAADFNEFRLRYGLSGYQP